MWAKKDPASQVHSESARFIFRTEIDQRMYAARYAAGTAHVYHNAGVKLPRHVWSVWDQQLWRPVLTLLY